MIIPPQYAALSDKEVAGILRVSKNAVVYARRREKGNCQRCDTPHLEGSVFCKRHRDMARKFDRKKGKFKPWKPGGQGRPPKS